MKHGETRVFHFVVFWLGKKRVQHHATLRRELLAGLFPIPCILSLWVFGHAMSSF